ncbi:GNVR domain-containing protein [Candidatus Omnitrophota bacterium]
MDEQQKKPFDINQYTRMIMRRKWFFVIPLILISISFLVASFFLPKVYEARAIILIEEKAAVNPLLGELAGSRTVKQRLNGLREQILAWPRLFQLVERLELNNNIDSPIQLEALIRDIRSRIDLQMRSDEIVVISFQGENPKKTQTLVNTLCDILIQRNVDSQIEDSESAIDFIGEQLAIYTEKLNTSDTALREFKEVYGLQMIAQGAIADQLGAGSESISSPKTPLYQINEEIATLEADLVMTTIDCTDDHPRVKSLKERIAALREKRTEYVDKVAKHVGVDSQTYVNIADSMPRQQEELTKLSRDKQINEKIYAMLLERLETAKITERLDSSDNRTKFRVIEPARLPLLPVKPNKAAISLVGLLLGGACGFGFVYFLDYTDSSFKTDTQLKEFFGYPVLGSISKIVTPEEMVHKKTTKRQVIWLSILLAAFLTLAYFMAKNVLPQMLGL